MNIDELCRDVLAASENRRIDVAGWMETACNAAPALARECQRLRAALKEVIENCPCCGGEGEFEVLGEFDYNCQYCKAARDALKKESK